MIKLFFKHATNRVCVKRSLKVALIVGTILALINQYDVFLSGNITSINIFQIILTYLVPYGVATFGSAMQAVHMET